ncbi:MAG: TlpA family protein disulfide reductase [Spirochaetes bacterium]|nr:TlpA family protein disulfide reductase [Spirochaetota bacterium]
MKLCSIILFSIITLVAVTPDIATARNAPGFALFNTEGKLVTLKSLTKEKPLVLSFFASYCVPCKREIPQLLDLEKKLPGRFNIMLVNIDREGKEKALEFLNGISVQRDCLLDIYQQTAKKYIPDLKVPALFLVDKRGAIVFEAVGDKNDTMAKLERAIRAQK